MGETVKLPVRSRNLKIVKIDKEKDYQRWLNFRMSGIGASETGTILGLNQWMSSIELYYQKIGVIPTGLTENLAMFLGNEHEPLLDKCYQHWDGSVESMIGNYRANNRVNITKQIKGYVINKKIPYMFFSPDRIILNEKRWHGVLEIKTISGWASKQYEAGIPPSYITQCQTYMWGLELPYCDLIIQTDGRDIEVVRIERNETLIEQIKMYTADFWSRVQKGKAAISCGGDYEQFAPPPDGSEAYSKFLNRQYVLSTEEIIYESLDSELYKYACSLASVSQQKKEIEEQETLYQNLLKSEMKDRMMIDFGEAGKITWKSDKNGKRTFRNLMRI